MTLASLSITVILDSRNVTKNKPVVSYDPKGQSRFGHYPEQIRWFETSAYCIFHTANTWDDKVMNKMVGQVETSVVNMLACS